ncbi:MAG: hypothetical protein U0Q10_15190 [Dermatophilaceae bacterium]
MFDVSTRRLSFSCGIAVAVATLLGSAPAYAAYSKPARPDAIEQAASTSFSGATFVRLVGVRCPGRGDGYFVIPSNGKQAQQVDIVMNALRGGLRVTFGHNPATCVASTVGICANGVSC